MSSTSIKRILIFTLLAAFAFFSWWLNKTNIPVASKLDGNLRHDPDYFAEGLVAYSLLASGVPQYLLLADHLYHYPDDKSTQLINPHIVFYQEKSPDWEIDAAEGLVISNGDEILLSGGVIAKQTDDNAVTLMKMTTEDLLFKPNEKFVKTDKDVLLEDDHGTIRATGMEAYTEKNTIQFLSNVRGEYAHP